VSYLFILSSVGLGKDQICWHRIFQFLQPMGSIGLLLCPIRSKSILTKYILKADKKESSVCQKNSERGASEKKKLKPAARGRPRSSMHVIKKYKSRDPFPLNTDIETRQILYRKRQLNGRKTDIEHNRKGRWKYYFSCNS
jgi:hypothetical protein